MSEQRVWSTYMLGTPHHVHMMCSRYTDYPMYLRFDVNYWEDCEEGFKTLLFLFVASE